MERKRMLVALPLIISGAAVAYKLYNSWQKSRQKKDNVKEEKEECQKSLGFSQIVLIENSEDWDKVAPIIEEDLQDVKVIGFDCEWVLKHNVSLLQIATQSGLCVLLRLCKMQYIPDGLKYLLSDKRVLKVGVGCLDDAKKLRNEHNLCVRGCIDLRHMVARSRTYKPWSYGLSGLAYCILGITLDKDPAIRCGNWEADVLSDLQIQYAATDALIGYRLFMKIICDKYDSALNRNRQNQDKNLWQTALSLVQGIVDVNYSRKGYGANSKAGQRTQLSTELSSSAPSASCLGTGSLQKNKSGNGKVKDVTRSYMLRVKPLYENCQLRAPDGQLLSTCDAKKALWYIEKGLGERISDTPLTVKLLFEPSGRPESEANYYLQNKENVCVVCGKEDSYIRKNVIPRDYRKNFPPLLKDHKSHDVVLLCTNCHQRSGVYDSSLRDELAIKCDAPLNQQNVKYTKDPQLERVRSAAKVVNSKYLPHGEKVVHYFMQHEGLLTLERLWREHFIQTMSPKHLPLLWSVDHSHERLKDIDANLKQALNS